MPYRDLLEQRRIRPHELTRSEVARRLRELMAAARQARADAGVEAQSLEGRYQDTYSCVRLWAEAVMTAEGYRAARGPGQHEVLFEFLGRVARGKWRAQARYFQRCRRQRHRTAYERIGLIGLAELEELIREADALAEEAQAWLAAGHPELKTGQS